jgi:ribosomal protein L11 methylase PrmA
MPGPTPSRRVHCIEAAGFDHPDLAAGAPYDLVFANILKGPLIALAPDMRAHMAPGGHAILSGILNEQADDVIAAYPPKASGWWREMYWANGRRSQFLLNFVANRGELC